MFSVNPACDYGHSEYASGEVDERAEVFWRCETKEIGIPVMKPFSGGQLLRDYSIIGSFWTAEAKVRCVCCNHCKPCPMEIDIGLVNKYYDLALARDNMAVQHYRELEKNVDDCIQYGHFDRRCHFSAHQSAGMMEIREYMNKV